MNLKKCSKQTKYRWLFLFVIMLLFCGRSGEGSQVFAGEIWSVNYGTEKAADKYFYQGDAVVDLEMPAAVFRKNKDTMKYSYERVRTGGASTESPIIWRPVWEIDETAKAKLCFPSVDGTEQEYQFHFQLFENGDFNSEVIVVDALAPVLETFEITAANDRPLEMKDANLYYVKNSEKGCVKIHLTINDHGQYFDENAVVLECRTKEEESWRRIESENWSSRGRAQKGTYLFDGDPMREAVFEFRVSYRDRAGNLMILKPGVEAQGISETFTAKKKVIIDRCAPELSELTFSKPICMFRDESASHNGTEEKRITNSETRMYYENEADITFGIEDADFSAEDVVVTIYRRENRENDWTAEGVAHQGSDIFKDDKFSFTMPYEEGEAYFTIRYTDPSENKIIYGSNMVTSEIGENYKNGIRDGVYISPVFVMDNQAPRLISSVYTAAEGSAAQDDNSTASVRGKIVFTEQNLDMKNTMVTVKAFEKNGKLLVTEEESKYSQCWEELVNSGIAVCEKGGVKVLTMELKTEGNYIISINCVDKTQKTVQHHKIFCIDRTAPEIEIDYPENAAGHKIDKITYKYFAIEQTTVQIKACDFVSGVKEICYTYQDVSGAAKTETVSADGVDQNDRNISVYNLRLPLGFKGVVTAYAVDKTGNAEPSRLSVTAGIITETERLHEDHAGISVAVTSNYSKTPNYYNRNVGICFKAKDGYSGLHEISYLAGTQLNETVDSYGAEGSEIEVAEITRNYTIPADQNNQNHVELGLSFLDNAGHRSEVAKEALPVVHIDTTKPEVDVAYDNNDVKNEKYYKAERTATVTVKERNFDPEDVTFHLSGPSVSISSWKHSGAAGCVGGNDPKNTGHTDSCKWISTVHFSADGDYSFGFDCVDLAGNKGSYGQTDVFVIDKTIPTIEVTYDNHNVKNGYYYNAPRMAAITIVEHNFDVNDVKITMTAKDNGQVIAVPAVSGWQNDGDTHKATVFYDYDGEFTFDIAYTDLAGNLAEEYTEDHFVVDLTEPEIIISEIEDGSANNDVVAPVITVTDTNYDLSNVSIVLDGCSHRVTAYQSTTAGTANGQVIRIRDIERVKEMDDLYTMTAAATDLAGNSFETSILFSVNRFGSVYTFDKKTEALIGEDGKYYTDTAQELVITETNVDTLEFQKITCSLNGKLRTLSEGVDYTVTASGNEYSWKQYNYQIHKENFKEDGQYILTIYSEDRATNASDNNSKGKKIEFMMDTVQPTVLISGVEDQVQYRESSREVTIDVEDNVQLAEVIITLGEKETVYSAAEIEEMGGKITFTIASLNEWQKLKVEVRDAAGNEPVVKELTFLINTNVFVHFFNNKPVFYGTIAALLSASGVWWFAAAKKRKKETKKRNEIFIKT